MTVKQLSVVELDWFWNQVAIHRTMLKAGLIWCLLFFGVKSFATQKAPWQ